MLRQIVKMVVDIMFPRNCINCGKEGKYICEECELFLSEVPSIFQQGNLEEVIGCWEYEGLAKKIIFKIKYDGVFDAINELIEMAFKRREPYLPENTIITFVPMFNGKEKVRGFNQAELIARKLGQMTGKNALPLLCKVKDTKSQTELDKEKRLVNVKNSFQVKEKTICPNNILLVDDVWTSGATMKECAKVLKRAGAKRIFGFTLARTI